MALLTLTLTLHHTAPYCTILRRHRTQFEGRSWAEVEVSAGEFSTAAVSIPARVAAAEQAFQTEFGEHLAEMGERCYFAVEEESGE